MKKSIIVILVICIILSPILQSFSQKGPLDELTDEEAKWLREEMEKLKREEKLRAELSVLIPIILGLGGIGISIMLIKHKRKKKN